ncbi:hypothetical protein T4B_4320 [Trichinella pseudospiralis]|uniref:Uncharacterized protein n=1 Tax=Trichinella pseudospiralis TaxID=6337 RepID=A0A0V1JTI6_TRIPS|nr:hypothetical protein T4A_12034 [Trichinella pseudospiralis]KRZ29051.1 hypothetical protein T4B_4320 [Trichinella pseudospiralis]KRZ38260.1 hypothetical protein T4C_11270 [Trichinella pseudospiralis]
MQVVQNLMQMYRAKPSSPLPLPLPLNNPFSPFFNNTLDRRKEFVLGIDTCRNKSQIRPIKLRFNGTMESWQKKWPSEVSWRDRSASQDTAATVVVVRLIRYLKMLPNEEKHRSSNEKTFCQTSKTKLYA